MGLDFCVLYQDISRDYVLSAIVVTKMKRRQVQGKWESPNKLCHATTGYGSIGLRLSHAAEHSPVMSKTGLKIIDLYIINPDVPRILHAT